MYRLQGLRPLPSVGVLAPGSGTAGVVFGAIGGGHRESYPEELYVQEVTDVETHVAAILEQVVGHINL